MELISFSEDGFNFIVHDCIDIVKPYPNGFCTEDPVKISHLKKNRLFYHVYILD